jgi:hypothetical protein
MVLDDRASQFLDEVRRAMAASNGSPSEASSILLEEVAAAVEASGFSSALNEMAAATLSSSVSVFKFFSSFLIQLFFLMSLPELDFGFVRKKKFMTWQFCLKELILCANFFLVGFFMELI